MKNKLIGIGFLMIISGIFMLTVEAMNNRPSRLDEAITDWNEKKISVTSSKKLEITAKNSYELAKEKAISEEEGERKLFCRIGHLKRADEIQFAEKSNEERFQNECGLNFLKEQ